MSDRLDLPANYRRKADECRMRAEVAGDAMTRMEWLQLAEQWQTMADDSVIVSLVSPTFSGERQ
jgi:hypothetical protein